MHPFTRVGRVFAYITLSLALVLGVLNITDSHGATSERDALAARLKTANAELDAAKRNLASAKTALSRHQSASSSAGRAASSAKAAFTAASARAKTAAASTRTVQRRLDAATARRNATTERLVTARKRVANIQKRLTDARATKARHARIVQLRGKLATERRAKSRVVDRVHERRGEVKKLTAAWRDVAKTSQAAEVVRAQREAEYQRAQGAANAAAAALASVKRTYDAAAQRVTAATKNRNSIRTRLTAVENATVSVKVDHLSGRWDRSATLLSKQIAQSMNKVDIITFTEMTSRARGKAMQSPGWTAMRGRDGASGEVGIMVRDSEWQVLAWRQLTLGPDLGPGGFICGIVAALQHRVTGERILVSTAHLPASVEGEWKGGRRAKAHRASVSKWRGIVNDWSNKHKTSGEVVTADWNLNLHLSWVRSWIRSAWPNKAIPAPLPAGGSHAGGRLIDWPITAGMSGVRFTIHGANAASDHRGIRVTGTLTRRGR